MYTGWNAFGSKSCDRIRVFLALFICLDLDGNISQNAEFFLHAVQSRIRCSCRIFSAAFGLWLFPSAAIEWPPRWLPLTLHPSDIVIIVIITFVIIIVIIIKPSPCYHYLTTWWRLAKTIKWKPISSQLVLRLAGSFITEVMSWSWFFADRGKVQLKSESIPCKT